MDRKICSYTLVIAVAAVAVEAVMAQPITRMYKKLTGITLMDEGKNY